MPKTANLNIRLDENIKKTAESVYSYYGLSLAEAVTVFIHQSCNVGGFPFDLRPSSLYENANLSEGRASVERIRENAKQNGTADMSMEEINSEIRTARAERKAKESAV